METQVSNIMHVSYLTIGLLFRIPQSTLLCFLSHIDMHQAIRRLKVFVGGDSLVAVDLILGKFHVTFHRVQSLDLFCVFCISIIFLMSLV